MPRKAVDSDGENKTWVLILGFYLNIFYSLKYKEWDCKTSKAYINSAPLQTYTYSPCSYKLIKYQVS